MESTLIKEKIVSSMAATMPDLTADKISDVDLLVNFTIDGKKYEAPLSVATSTEPGKEGMGVVTMGEAKMCSNKKAEESEESETAKGMDSSLPALIASIKELVTTLQHKSSKTEHVSEEKGDNKKSLDLEDKVLIFN